MDWILIGNWIVRGLLLAAIVFVVIYVLLWLIRQLSRPPQDAELSAETIEVGDEIPIPLQQGVPASAPAAVESQPVRRADVHHAFEFNDDETFTAILQMPTEYLNDQEALVEIWVEVVGWARVEMLAQQNESLKLISDPASPPGKRTQVTDPEQLQDQLNQVLYRLQISAERRRQLRAMLEEKITLSEVEEEI